ncbi:Hypothetical predicted protein [Olea europaea subsp. europaea]|uniref:Uncharacterized protein n=1 Tax=Olea europaea subsp. europaea TaxID=158383 RepID=A0A8S0SMQ8_OLEEU|nr:Hypothetical predicted protein [Olea europaea subsp. europaea]
MDKGFWMPKGGGPMTDGDAVFGNLSSMEPKRGRQWFSDAAEPELIPNKKQTVESPIVKPAAGISMSNALHWDYSSGFHSVPNQFIDRLFGPETTRSVNLTERNMSTVGTDGLNMRKKFVDEQFGNDSSVGLSISYGIEDPETCISYGGIRKVKVNQVKDSENGLLASLEQNVGISMDQTYSRGSTDTFISMGQPYGSGDANMRSVSSNSRKGNDHVTLMSHSYDKGETNTISFGGYQDESVLDALARPIGSYSLLYEQSSDQTSEIPSKKAVDVQNANITMSTSQAPKSRPDSTSKNKSETKPSRKEAPNSFPSNVRSLIATNILDGVPVRYVSVSREVIPFYIFFPFSACLAKLKKVLNLHSRCLMPIKKSFLRKISFGIVIF